MRCSCRECEREAYMVHAESAPGCVCPECGARCRDCLGTATGLTQSAIAAMKAVTQSIDDRSPPSAPPTHTQN